MELPTHQLTILKYLYRFRFLTSKQLHALLKLKSISLTNYHLQQLATLNCVGKHYSRSLGQGNQPATYYLTSGSIPYISDMEGFDKRTIKRIYREKTRSQQFIAHALFIADFFLFAQDGIGKTTELLQFLTRTELAAYPFFIHPLPDAYMVRKEKNGDKRRYLIEVVEDSSPRFALRKRVEQYCDYIDDGKFTEATGHDFPTLLFICPGFASLIYLKKHIARIYEETPLDQIEIYIATKEQAFAGSWEKIEAEDD